ncbi:MAG: SDR family oxidoreductase [Porticoccaceae bacterium]|nr:SDR family oxidoreductase [Porticoccaceae bacterium]
MDKQHKGRLAVVTGAAGEIGREVVARLVAAGAKVLAVDLDPLALQQMEKDFGSAVKTVVADVSDEASVQNYAEMAARLGNGKVDLFFNNAGIEGPVAPITNQDVNRFDMVMGVNVRGVFLGLKHILRLMGKGGVVVNTASTAALRGAVGLSPYIASKHAVLGLTKTAALEVADKGIRVCAVCPGPVEGKMMNRITEKRNAVQGATAPTPGVGLGGGRLAKVDEIAAAILFLFSDDASFVTGAPFIVDGGRSA